MNIDLDQRVRRVDPAHAASGDLFDPQGCTGTTIHARALATDDVADATFPSSRRRWRTLAAGVLAVAVVGSGAVAVADRRPPEISAEVCDSLGTDGWPNLTPPACADVVIPSVLASIEATGSVRERQLVADGVISEDEWEGVNDDLIACLQSGGLDAELEPQVFLDATEYAITWRNRDGLDEDRLVRHCEAQHKPYRVVALYQAQAIGRQEGPRLAPTEIQSILDEDVRRFGDVYGPDDPDSPPATMTPPDGQG